MPSLFFRRMCGQFAERNSMTAAEKNEKNFDFGNFFLDNWKVAVRIWLVRYLVVLMMDHTSDSGCRGGRTVWSKSVRFPGACELAQLIQARAAWLRAI